MDVPAPNAFPTLPGFTPYVPIHNRGYKKDGRVLNLQLIGATRTPWQQEPMERAVSASYYRWDRGRSNDYIYYHPF